MKSIYIRRNITKIFLLFLYSGITFAGQYAILKADDFAITPAYLKYIDLIERKKIVSGLGLVGKSFLDHKHKPEFIPLIKKLHKKGSFEFWNHGYDHDWGGIKDGTGEFSGKSVDYQVSQLQKAQQIVKLKTGIVMTSFGAPGNMVDKNTPIALKKVPEIKVWMFNGEVKPPEGVTALPIRTNIEWKEDNQRKPNVEKFKKRYDPKAPYILLQLHPKQYTEENLEHLEKTIDFLISNKVIFILPTAGWKI